MSEVTNEHKCSKCEQIAIRFAGGQKLCMKHYRFGQMRATAKRRGKAVPAYADLEIMDGVDLSCPDCSVRMNWSRIDGNATVATLQHYRDGSMAIVCMSCNSRHASMPGDTYKDLPLGHKICTKCKGCKPFSEFGSDRGRGGALKITCDCKACRSESRRLRTREQRDKWNIYQRAWRATKRLQEGV